MIFARLLALCLTATATATAAQAGSYPDGVPGAEVARLVTAALEQAGAGGDVTSPLRPYPPCTGSLTVAPRGGDWATAEITCTAPRWARALRTGAKTDAGPTTAPHETAPAMVVALKRSLPRGATLTAADLVLAPATGLGPDDIFLDPAELSGRRLKSAVGAGKPVLTRHVEPRWLVEPGAPLVLVATAGGLQVSAPAEARDAGLMGDVVRVINLSSGREVRAIVTGPNQVATRANIP